MTKTNYGIYLGHTPEASQHFSRLFLAILNSKAGDMVKKQAFCTLKDAYQIQNVSISNCSIVMEPHDQTLDTA